MQNKSSLSELGLIRLNDIIKLIPIGKSTWWAGVRAGIYPKPVQLGARITAWRIKEITALIESFK